MSIKLILKPRIIGLLGKPRPKHKKKYQEIDTFKEDWKVFWGSFKDVSRALQKRSIDV